MKKNILVVMTLLFVLAIVGHAWSLGNTFRIEPTGVLQEDLVLNLFDGQFNSENMCFNSGALATATADVSIATAIDYTHDGIFGQIATGTIAPTGDTQAVSTTRLYAFSYDTTNSTTEVTQGAAGLTAIKSIEIPAGNVLIGYMKMVTDSTHTYVPGTTTIGGSGVTGTYYNMAMQPSRVRVSKTSK